MKRTINIVFSSESGKKAVNIVFSANLGENRQFGCLESKFLCL